ncbi:sensor histidine kinase [Atopobacter phocae]|uniref:sensor histidine kinase n=1 Tax=Atopobacter phocae TaxID=136492 RepID=UPI00047098DA|nr:ATP-binding protein [Atopobacter phocae]
MNVKLNRDLLKRDESVRLKLSKREKSELIFEGIFTAALMYLIYLCITLIMQQFLGLYLQLVFQQNGFLDTFDISLHNWTAYRMAFDISCLILGIIVIYWRLARRIRQMQLFHILEELHYIANGHYNYQIPFQIKGELGEVVYSINAIVRNTVEAMEEERRIEQSKDELITNVSHDIRTPLTSIIGYLDLVRDGRYEDAQEAIRYVNVAAKKAQQMRHLVDDLFEYTTTRSVQNQLNKQLLNFPKFLEQISAEFEWEANRKEVEIRLDEKVESDDLMVLIDPAKMVRVFSNIITNALKYGEGATYIRINYEVDRELGELMIQIANNGEAIPIENLDSLFTRFYRVEGSRSVETGGSGLGLAISDNIVRLHRGRIDVESSAQETVFTIYLPIDESNRESSELEIE